MTKEQTALLDLARVGVTAECFFCDTVSDIDWSKLFKLACKQGLACVAWHGIEILYKHGINKCAQEVKLQWYIYCQNIESANRMKRQDVKEFVDVVAPIKLAVLKGIHYSKFWPKSEWREFGDLDCVAFESGVLRAGYSETLDKKAVAAGCRLEEGDFKHTQLFWKKLMIENHHAFTSYGGSRNTELLEKELKSLFESNECQVIDDIGLYAPNVNFTAVYMVAHSRNHFFYEGMTLRQTLDWNFFLQQKGGNVDWQLVEDVLERTKLKTFAILLTQICKKYFGLRFDYFVSDSPFDNEFAIMFLDDVFSDKYNDHDRRWWMMILRLLNRFARMWKFRSLLHIPILNAIWKTFTYSSFFHRTAE